MAVELDPAMLLQVDATIITGILILLTLAHLKTTFDNKGISMSVSFVVIPFGISAILILFASCGCLEIDEHLVTASQYLMMFGFGQIIVTVVAFTQKKSKESSKRKND